jgi:hypothetical protein
MSTCSRSCRGFFVSTRWHCSWLQSSQSGCSALLGFRSSVPLRAGVHVFSVSRFRVRRSVVVSLEEKEFWANMGDRCELTELVSIDFHAFCGMDRLEVWFVRFFFLPTALGVFGLIAFARPYEADCTTAGKPIRYAKTS